MLLSLQKLTIILSSSRSVVAIIILLITLQNLSWLSRNSKTVLSFEIFFKIFSGNLVEPTLACIIQSTIDINLVNMISISFL